MLGVITKNNPHFAVSKSRLNVWIMCITILLANFRR